MSSAFTGGSGRGTLPDMFSESVRRSGDRPAVVASDVSITYRRLDEWSDAIAVRLVDLAVGPGHRVALRLPPGIDVIAAQLAILKTGAAYVPLDTRNPPRRDEHILEDSACSAFVGTECASLPDDVPRLSRADLAAVRDVVADHEVRGPRPHDIAYVIYTSGTTGAPKGVPIRHENVTALFAATAGLFDFRDDDRWLLFHSLAFDVSVWEIWGALTTGAALNILPMSDVHAPRQTLEVLRDRAITVLNQTPTALAALAHTADGPQDLASVRYLILAGERFPPSSLRAWEEKFGLDRPRLVNMYGITETTVHATHHQISEADLNEPDSVIGKPLPGFTVRVEPDGPGPGELWLAGPQVAAGYLNRDELGRERFPVTAGVRYYRSGDLVSQGSDGLLRYHGRVDDQIKLRGHRIEPGEVEAAVRQHSRVTAAVVSVLRFGPGDERLVCAVAVSPDAHVTTAELREHARACLPTFMRPARYRILAEVPRTVNGKFDRPQIQTLWADGL